MATKKKEVFNELLQLTELTYYSFGGGLTITYRESDIEKFKNVIDKAKKM